MKNKSNIKWILQITVLSIVISVVFTLVSTEALAGAGYFLSFLLLTLFVFIGIFFDIVGVAVTSAVEAPFHSMASHKEKGAVEAIKLIKNAEKVSSICNDVVGDISGIVSGTTSSIIVAMLVNDFTLNNVILQLIMSGIVSGLTIGGKAIGKTYAMRKSTFVVLTAGKFIAFFNKIKIRKRK
ncbi:MAG: hypothetical protein E7456_03495 [Ruminococcaceae bacterium]|nr:hypothetical protein [Oscillospiraceae bacterium]